MRQVLNVISFAVMILGAVVAVAGGALMIWGRQSPHHIIAAPTLMMGLMLLCFGGAGVGFSSVSAPPPGACPKCGYDRKGLAEGAPCPECGKRGQ